MAFVKNPARTMNTAGSMEPIQTITNSTATRIRNYGVTTLASTLGSTGLGLRNWKMDKPKKGLVKTLVVDPNSSAPMQINNYSTTITFFGTTGNALLFSTGAGVRDVTLIGLSSAQWAMTSRSTGVTITATTIKV